ncbi:class I SAM-dependent methyltransferase [Sphingomonas qilianensis]|uniref:Class I SAM-dependent methyltransferase n=1 Tax=Sphingomonas qilianensis TaxID=1736690 RepID=A0ABU9XVI3_9SPHN
MLNWLDEATFKIGDVTFTLDYMLGGSKRPSDVKNFTMMKATNFLDKYLSLQGKGIQKVLELGVYQGGSYVFLDKLLRPARISAVELETKPIPALDRYISENRERCKLYYGTSQADVDALERIVRDDFDGELDLVVDDASHFYELTKTSFETLFPRLKPGGTYIIEDWSWSFEPSYQDTSHSWFTQPSLANIFIDLAEELSINNSVHEVTIGREMIVITKTTAAKQGPLFQGKGRRGRDLQLL